MCHNIARRHISEDKIVQYHLYENLKPELSIYFLS